MGRQLKLTALLCLITLNNAWLNKWIKREFSDYENISEYALPKLAWGVNTGLMQGANNKLMPKDSATRAQVATILVRFSETTTK